VTARFYKLAGKAKHGPLSRVELYGFARGALA